MKGRVAGEWGRGGVRQRWGGGCRCRVLRIEPRAFQTFSIALSPAAVLRDGTFAAPGLEVLDLFQAGGVLEPLDHLDGGHDVHVLQLHQLVDEAIQGFKVVLRVEPSGVDEDAEGGSVGVVVPFEIGPEELEVLVHVRRSRATVGHGAGVSVYPVPPLHGDLPQARVLLDGAGFVLAVDLGHGVVKGEGPDGVTAFPHGASEHGGVVDELLVVEGLVHAVSAQLQEGNAEALNAFVRDSGVRGQLPPHAFHLVHVLLVGGGGPPGVRELVSDGVAGDLHAHGVQRVHQVQVRARARHEQAASHRAPVGVVPTRAEEALKVAVVSGRDLVVEGKHDHLRGGFSGEAARDVGTGASAVGHRAF